LRRITSWLLKGPQEGVVIALDRWILFSLKIIYLGIRILLRISLGKKRRDRILSERFRPNEYFSLSFYLFKSLYKSIKFFRLGNTMLIKIVVPKYDYKFYCRVNKEDYTTREDEIVEHFRPKEGDIVVDVGAHIGRYTIIASKRVGESGKVIAIEAHPGNFEMLNRNVKLNKLTNVTALNYAVYSKESKLRLYVPGEESGFTIYNTVTTNRAKTDEKFIEVNANTLDNLLLQQQQQHIPGINHADINWIKIDVEGAEFEVLKGATDILSNSKDIALLIEVHNLNDGTNLYMKIVEFLGSCYNFKIEYEKIHDGGERHIIVRKST
jgi:FkbM family methyltransferase